MQPVVVLRTVDPSIPSFQLESKEGPILVGRSSTCEFVIKHISVSRRHAEISMRNGSITIVDLNSRNGTFVDEQRVETAKLACGQRLRFGQIAFVVTDDPSRCGSEVNTDMPSKSPAASEPLSAAFSPAQRRVVRLVLEGHSEKEVAKRLHLSRHTVHNHLQAIYALLGVHSRTELVSRLLREGKEQFQ
jgi:DNA-binding CsgD family transcriptional regulator